MNDQQETSWGLPIPPEKAEDNFTKMAQLFIDCWNELSDAIVHLDMEHGCKEYTRLTDLEEMQKRYIEIIKEYQEQLFAQPAPLDEKQKYYIELFLKGQCSDGYLMTNLKVSD